MERSQAKAIVGALMAGWPSADVPQATVELYTTQIAKLSNTEAAFAAVEALIASREWFPSFAAFREEYLAAAKRLEPPALPQLEAPETPPEVKKQIMADAQRWLLARQLPDEDLSVALPRGGAGSCDDCTKEFEERYVYGAVTLCAGCALPRLRVRTELAEAEKRPPVPRVPSGPPIPQPNFKRMPDHKRGAPADEAWFQKAYR